MRKKDDLAALNKVGQLLVDQINMMMSETGMLNHTASASDEFFAGGAVFAFPHFIICIVYLVGNSFAAEPTFVENLGHLIGPFFFFCLNSIFYGGFCNKSYMFFFCQK